MHMIKLSINTSKSQFPLRIARGTPQERIQKAVSYTDRFFENIIDCFQNGDVSPKKFESVLKKTAGSKVGIEIDQSSNRGGITYRNYTENGEQIGYAILLPYNTFSQKISKMTTKTFMHEVFHFFDHLLNPKYNKRIHNLTNSGYNTYDIGAFYNKNIYTKENLTSKTLNDFLEGRPAQEQIDCLQYFRHGLKLEQNAYTKTAKYQQMMENYYKDSINYHETPYRYGEYNLPKKIKLIEKKLAQILTTERAKIQNSVI